MCALRFKFFLQCCHSLPLFTLKDFCWWIFCRNWLLSFNFNVRNGKSDGWLDDYALKKSHLIVGGFDTDQKMMLTFRCWMWNSLLIKKMYRLITSGKVLNVLLIRLSWHCWLSVSNGIHSVIVIRSTVSMKTWTDLTEACKVLCAVQAVCC